MPCINSGKDEILNISKRFPQHIERIAEWEFICGQASQRSSATFFASPGTNDGAYERGNVRQVVEWSKTQRGGTKYDMFRVLDEGSGCSSSFGLCEAAELETALPISHYATTAASISLTSCLAQKISTSWPSSTSQPTTPPQEPTA